MRTVQETRVKATMATARATSGCSSDRNGAGLPRAETSKSQGIRIMQVGARRLPAGLARQDRIGSTRTNQANEVVIPQVGQGRPVEALNAQGQRPNRSCV